MGFLCLSVSLCPSLSLSLSLSLSPSCFALLLLFCCCCFFRLFVLCFIVLLDALKAAWAEIPQ